MFKVQKISKCCDSRNGGLRPLIAARGSASTVDTALKNVNILYSGKWTAISALEYGMPVTLIGESVFARCLSSLKVMDAHGCHNRVGDPHPSILVGSSYFCRMRIIFFELRILFSHRIGSAFL